MSAITEAVQIVARTSNDVRWSIEVLDDTGQIAWHPWSDDRVCQTASIGKLLLLIKRPLRSADGRLSATESPRQNP